MSAARECRLKRGRSRIARCVASSMVADMVTTEPVIRVQGLRKTYVHERPFSGEKFVVRALEGLDLVLSAGSSFALVGESGSGESTLALCLARLEQPGVGRIRSEGHALLGASGPVMMR